MSQGSPELIARSQDCGLNFFKLFDNCFLALLKALKQLLVTSFETHVESSCLVDVS